MPGVLDRLGISYPTLVDVQEVFQLFENVLDPPPAGIAADDLLWRHVDAVGEEDVHALLTAVVQFAYRHDSLSL